MVKIDCFFFKLTSGGADIFYSYVALFQCKDIKQNGYLQAPSEGLKPRFALVLTKSRPRMLSNACSGKDLRIVSK